MKIITLEDIKETERQVHCPSGGFISYRYLLRDDGMGFSMSMTVIPKGEFQRWHYKNHLEACFCVSGAGIIVDNGTGAEFEIKPTTVYVLDGYEDHSFKAIEDTALICIFNPPLIGAEVHSDDGSYPLEACNE